MMKQLILGIFVLTASFKMQAAEKMKLSLNSIQGINQSQDYMYVSHEVACGLNTRLIVTHYNNWAKTNQESLPYLVVNYLKAKYKLQAETKSTSDDYIRNTLVPDLERKIKNRIGLDQSNFDALVNMKDLRDQIENPVQDPPSLKDCMDDSQEWGLDLEMIKLRERLLRENLTSETQNDVSVDIRNIRTLKAAIQGSKKTSLEIATEVFVNLMQKEKVVVMKNSVETLKLSLAETIERAYQKFYEAGFDITKKQLKAIPPLPPEENKYESKTIGIRESYNSPVKTEEKK